MNLVMLLPLGYLATNVNLQCAPLKDVALDTSSYLDKFPGVGSGDACCQLCGGEKGCTAYTIKNSTCFILEDLSHPSAMPGTLSGYTPAARVHNQDPTRAGCVADEISNYVPGIDGSFCSAACTGDNWCPPTSPRA